MDPGPEDPSVLYEQMIHRSTQIWDYGQEFTLQTRNGNRTVIEGYRVQQYLKMTGFYGLYHLGFVRTDRPLVSALVERWRPETHTFHMPTTECTITLQDVEVLLGVPIDGKAIISNYHTTDKSVWRAHCIRLLGLDPGDNVKGAKLKMGWLRSHVQSHPLHPNVSEEDVRCRTRAVILLLLGGQYLSDKSGSYVWLRYLLFLEDLEHCKDYSWGSAILATLYRNMCYSAYGGSDIAGPLILLQIWAWIRFPPIRPVQINELIHFPEEDDPLLPVYTYAYRWAKAARVYNPDTVGHGLRHFRDLFDRLKDDQIIWEPYENLDLPDYCCAGKNIWRARVPLICFELVEYYHPERVNRQFGMRQGIPIAAFKDTTLHNHTGRGHKDEKWENFHKKFVEEWDDRHQRVVNGDYHNGFQDCIFE